MEHLKLYLKRYKFDEPVWRRLERCDFTPEDFEKLKVSRDRLLDESAFSDSENWFNEFAGDFQGSLDEAAKRLIRDYMRNVFLLTTVAPNALVDSAVVLFQSNAMLADLCEIYNLRVDAWGLVRLLGKVFAFSYLSGSFEVASEHLSSAINVGIDHLSTAGANLTRHSLEKAIGKLTPKLAVGSANAAMIYRLGWSTVVLLRPMEPLNRT